MWNRVRTAILSIFCFGLVVTSASALESRVGSFVFACDGSAKLSVFNASALGNSVNRFVVGAEIVLFENTGGLQYIFLAAQNSPNGQILSMSKADNRVQVIFTSFMVTPTNATPRGLFRSPYWDPACQALDRFRESRRFGSSAEPVPFAGGATHRIAGKRSGNAFLNRGETP